MAENGGGVMQRRRFNTEEAVRHILALLGGAVTTAIVSGIYGSSLVLEALVFFGATIATGYFLGLYRPAPDIELVGGDVEHMIGRRVRVMKAINPRGKILYHSALWTAVSDTPIEEDEWVEIVAVKGKIVTVKRWGS